MTARASAWLLLRLGDLLQDRHFSEREVGLDLGEVVVQSAVQVVGGEVGQDIVRGDQKGDCCRLSFFVRGIGGMGNGILGGGFLERVGDAVGVPGLLQGRDLMGSARSVRLG